MKKASRPLYHPWRVLPVLLFVWYFGNTTLCVHTHTVDGVPIVHSHAGSARHSHTAGEYQLVYTYDGSAFIAAERPDYSIALPERPWLMGRETVVPLQAADLRYVSLRAPPAL